jgi:hypothetical protein
VGSRKLYYYPHMRRFSIVTLLGLLLLAGCISTETDISISSDGSGTIEIVYQVDRMTYETGVFDDGGPGPIPLRRVDFQNAAAAVDGLRLRRYRSRTEDEIVTVTARLSFDTADALVSFIGEEYLEITSRGDRTTWRQVIIPEGLVPGEGAAALAADLEPYTISYRIDPDAPIISVSGGTLSGGDDAVEVEVTLGQMITGDPLVLEVVW